MFYVYVLRSLKDCGLYIGYTSDLDLRFKRHNSGNVLSTKYRQPLEIIYYEFYINLNDAKGREVFLKSGAGWRFLKKQLRHTLESRSVSDDLIYTD